MVHSKLIIANQINSYNCPFPTLVVMYGDVGMRDTDADDSVIRKLQTMVYKLYRTWYAEI